VASAGSSAPLAANAEYVSAWQVRKPYHSRLQGSIFTDAGGTIHIQQSSTKDSTGEFVPDVDAEYEVSASDGAAIEETLKCRRWRVRYVNGPGKQTIFRLGISAQPTEPQR
jgi:hypothetical protein